MFKKVLLALSFALTSLGAQATISACVIGVDTSAVFGEASFGALNPLALPGGATTTSFTYFGECNRSSNLDPQRVQFRIIFGSMSANPGLTVGATYSSALLTLDWNRNERTTKRTTATATFTLNGMTATTAPGLRTFTQLTTTQLRTCPDNSNFGCSGYGTARLEDVHVYLNVLKSCSIAPATLNFGNVVPDMSNSTDATSNAGVACTNTTPYTVAFSGGTAAPLGLRNMVRSGGSDTLTYQVYSNPARTTALVGATTLAATGTGASQSFSLYGRVFPAQYPPAGSYADALTMTITY